MTRFLSKVNLVSSAALLVLVASCGLVKENYKVNFNKDGSAKQPSDDVDTREVPGGVAGAFSASATTPQTLSTAADSPLKGSSLLIPAGALAIDTEISMTVGASIASETEISSRGLNGQLLGTGSPVTVSASQSINTNVPFTLSLPTASGSALTADEERLIVLYTVMDAATGQSLKGIFQGTELNIVPGFVQIQSRFFGTFQVARIKVVTPPPAPDAPTERRIVWQPGMTILSSGTSVPQAQGRAGWGVWLSPGAVDQKTGFSSSLVTSIFLEEGS